MSIQCATRDVWTVVRKLTFQFFFNSFFTFSNSGTSLACSGHGYCLGSPTFQCVCSAGYTGGDCSERTCPNSYSWFDTPVAEGTHFLFSPIFFCETQFVH